MKKMYFFLFLVSVSFTATAQKTPWLQEVLTKKATDQVSYIFTFSFSNLEEDAHIKALEEKYDLELTSLYSCINTYAKSIELNFSKDDKKAIQQRIKNIAEHFYASKRYTLLKDTSGMAPVFGVDVATIAKKQVLIVLTGGDCMVTEEDKLRDEISTVFNKKMNALLLKN